MRSSWKREIRASLPSGGSRVGGEPPELDQPGLALMERQAIKVQMSLVSGDAK